MAKLLLVEDDPMISRMLSLRLQMRGHEVDTALNGKEGMEKALAGNFALVLMDMHMPVMDGHAATTQLRAQGYTGTIIAVTASAMSKDCQNAIAAGCDHYITKPVADNFEDQIDNYLTEAADNT